MEPDNSTPKAIPYESAPARPMPFVRVGAPGIATLANPRDLAQRVLEKAGANQDALASCDVWGFHFTAATGVEPPDVAHGCFAGRARGDPVAFQRWFAWLLEQPE